MPSDPGEQMSPQYRLCRNAVRLANAELSGTSEVMRYLVEYRYDKYAERNSVVIRDCVAGENIEVTELMFRLSEDNRKRVLDI